MFVCSCTLNIKVVNLIFKDPAVRSIFQKCPDEEDSHDQLSAAAVDLTRADLK